MPAGAIYLGSGNTTTYSLYSTTGATTVLNGSTAINLTIGGGGEVTINDALWSWTSGIVNPLYKQVALGSTSAGGPAIYIVSLRRASMASLTSWNCAITSMPCG